MRRALSGVAAGLRSRPLPAAGLIYAVAAIVLFAPGLAPGKTLSNADTVLFDPPWVAGKPASLALPSNTDLGDEPEQMLTFLRRATDDRPDTALWNPNIMGGRPFHANAQSALFGPYTWPAHVLPFWTAWSWTAVLKVWVAAFGTFLLGRALGMRFAGALLAGLVFAFSLRLVTWVSYPAMGVWTFYPWLLLCTERVVRRPDLLAGSALAAVAALQFLTGHPESSFHALLLTAAFFVLRLWQARRAGALPGGGARRAALGLVGGLAGGACVAAVALIPFAELLSQSSDLVDRRGSSVGESLPFQDVLGLFFPDFWGRATQTPYRALLLERALYVGALPLLLAAVALVRRPSVERVAVALFGAFWLAVALGVPPFVQVVTRLPVFNSGHNTRLVVFTMLAVALLAGWGLDELVASRGSGRQRRRVTVAAAALVVVPALVLLAVSPNVLGVLGEGVRVGLLLGDPPGSIRDLAGLEILRAASLVLWLALAAAAAALVVARLRGRIGGPVFAALAAALVCVDLFRAGMGYNPGIERRDADPPTTGAVRFLRGQGQARFVSTDDFPQNILAMDDGLYEARGYDIPLIRRYDRLWRSEVMPGERSVAAGFLDIPLRFPKATPRALRTLRLLGVTHVLAPKSVWPSSPPFDRTVPRPPLTARGLTEVYDGPDARVYRVEGALPRAWVAGAQRVAGGEDAARRVVTRPNFDPRTAAVTERRVPGVKEGSGPSGTARITRYDSQRVVMRATSPAGGFVVLGDTFYPGWKAKVDGRSASVEPVDSVLRGVRVGPGRHTVELRYQPLSWRIGWIVSSVSLVALAVAVAVGLRRRRGAAA